MKEQYAKLIVKQFDNIANCVTKSREQLVYPIEWLEYLQTHTDYSNSELADRNLIKLKNIDSKLFDASMRLETFKCRAIKSYEKKYKLTSTLYSKSQPI